MITFSLRLANPFKHKPFQNYWQGDYLITKNKMLEIGFYKYAWDLFELSVDLRWQGHDHAGPSFEINFFGYTGRIAVADRRHWDSEANTWAQTDAIL
jgi:hypothetical protein